MYSKMLTQVAILVKAAHMATPKTKGAKESRQRFPSLNPPPDVAQLIVHCMDVLEIGYGPMMQDFIRRKLLEYVRERVERQKRRAEKFGTTKGVSEEDR